MKNSIHEQIIQHVKPTAIDGYLKYKPHNSSVESSEISDDLLFHFIFQNYRKSNNQKHFGLRLSYVGLSIMSKHFVSYTFKHSLNQLPNKLLLTLDKQMCWPYYVSKSHIVLFSETDAIWLRLCNQDLDQFLGFSS